MTYSEFKKKIVELIGYCDINQRYHQRLGWWFGVADKLAKISVAIVAVVAVVLALSGEEWKIYEVGWAIAAAVLAVVLNVLPFGEYEKFYDEMFRSWSDLRIEAETQKVKVRGEPGANVPDHVSERFTELNQRQHSLNSEEPSPWRWLLKICQQDRNQRKWGVRTNEEVRAERARRAAAAARPAVEANPHREVVQ